MLLSRDLPMNCTAGRRRVSRGFSLLEVMVALVVLSIGLLGVAKLETAALSSTTVARNRSLAALEADSLAAAMHVNRGYWSNADAAGVVVSINGTTVAVTGGAPLLAAALAGVGTCPGTGVPCGCTSLTVPCPVATLAAVDLSLWATTLKGLLANDTATVACGALTPVTCTITVRWLESSVAVNAQEAAAQTANPTATFESPVYTLYVQP